MLKKLWPDRAAEAPKEAAPAPETPDPREGVEQLEDGRVRMRLQWPIELGGKRVEELVLRRPRGADMKRLSSIDPSQMRPYDLLQFMAGLIEGHPSAIADKLDLEDVRQLDGVAELFFRGGPPTGAGD